MTKNRLFSKSLLVVLPVVTKDYVLKNDVSDDPDERIFQAHAIADFSAQIASAAGIVAASRRACHSFSNYIFVSPGPSRRVKLGSSSGNRRTAFPLQVDLEGRRMQGQISIINIVLAFDPIGLVNVWTSGRDHYASMRKWLVPCTQPLFAHRGLRR